jgi:Excalibur calcium-binding domain
MARNSFLKSVAPLAGLTFLAVYNFPMQSLEQATETRTAEPANDEWSAEEPAEEAASERSVYYRYCSDVRAAGQAPLHAGEPGYAAHLDRDGDGVACEPYH